MSRARWGANLATLANALVGVGAVLYILAGNKLWAALLIVCGVGFDGLDGLLSRRDPGGPSRFGRIADSVADAITFGIAPATMIMVHTDRALLWVGSSTWTLGLSLTFAALAISRLTYFTLRGFALPDFLGAPTPQAALGLVVATLFWDVPAFAGTQPSLFVLVASLLALSMIIPVRFPKVRRGSVLRAPMIVTGLALAAALIPLQFRPAVGSGLFDVALISSAIAGSGILLYYLAGPLTLRSRQPRGAAGEPS